MNLPECRLPKTHKEIVRIMVFSIPCLKDGQATSNTKARAPLPGFSRVIWDEWGKKGVRMDTKALKKQMGAAIAMVLVAAVALGSATFAWFVSNNSVKATTSSISAQSNAAYMTIAKGTTGAKDANESAVETDVKDTPLFPATFGEQADSDGNAHPGLFYTGNGTTTTDGKLKDALEKVGANGTPAEAAEKGYAVHVPFNVSTKGQKMKDLKVAGITNGKYDAKDEANNGSALAKALRVLVVDGTDSSKWVVYGQEADSTKYVVKLSSETGNAVPNFGEVLPGQDHVVNVYLYYEGSDHAVYTNNLANLTKTNKVTVEFAATPNGNN